MNEKDIAWVTEVDGTVHSYKVMSLNNFEGPFPSILELMAVANYSRPQHGKVYLNNMGTQELAFECQWHYPQKEGEDETSE